MKNIDLQFVKKGGKTTLQIRHKGDKGRWGEWADVPVHVVEEPKPKAKAKKGDK